jgi:hypothetical protein
MAHISVLPFLSGGGSVTIGGGPDKPRILYNNLMRTGSPTLIAATSEPDPTNYAYQRAYDDRPYTYWMMEAGTQYLTFTFASAKRVSAYGIYSTTLAEAGATAQLQYSTNGGGLWNDFTTAEAPVDTTPIYRSLTAVDAAMWRWKFVTPVDLYIGCLAFGEDFQFQRGCWMGFSPPKLARDTDLTNNVSQGGVWLGRSIIRNGAKFSFDLDKLTASWVNSTWYPFMLHAERRPWWLLWEKASHPAEAAFCWSEGKIQKPANSHSNFMNAGMNVCARTDAV